MNFKINPFLLILLLVCGILIYHLKLLSNTISYSANKIRRRKNHR